MSTVASYLPESMFIKIGPDLTILDEMGKPGGFATPQAASFFFHEYLHYLHNVSTISGISAFLNCIELWICFGRTISDDGLSGGSTRLDADLNRRARILGRYVLKARLSNKPLLGAGVAPVAVSVKCAKLDPCVRFEDEILLSDILCRGEVEDAQGNKEETDLVVGTLEILEGIAWAFERKMLNTISPGTQISNAPTFPYKSAEAVARCLAPSIDDDVRLVCMLSALQSSDAPSAYFDCLLIAENAMRSENEPRLILEESVSRNIENSLEQLEACLKRLEARFGDSGVIPHALSTVVAVTRNALCRRIRDPFFEFQMTDQPTALAAEWWRGNGGLLPCSLLQKLRGDEDELCRDHIYSFFPNPEPDSIDSEDAARVLHCAFDFMWRHISENGFSSTDQTIERPCPFYTCCDLPPRKAEATPCKSRPWNATQFCKEGQGCWYSAAVHATHSTKPDVSRT